MAVAHCSSGPVLPADSSSGRRWNKPVAEHSRRPSPAAVRSLAAVAARSLAAVAARSLAAVAARSLAAAGHSLAAHSLAAAARSRAAVAAVAAALKNHTNWVQKAAVPAAVEVVLAVDRVPVVL